MACSNIPHNEGMENYMLRLSSFDKFPQSVDISSIELTAAGFYYTGKGDEVQCHKCSLKLKDWGPGMKPMNIHKHFSPSCIFITNNTTSKNQNINANRQSIVPLIEKLSNLSTESRSTESWITSGSNTYSGAGITSTQDPQSAAESQHLHSIATHNVTYSGQASVKTPLHTSNYLQRPGNYQIPGNPLKNIPPHVGSHSSNGTNLFSNPQGSSTLFAPTEEQENTSDYLYEKNRLESFTYWPSTAAVLPKDLAKAGFYYLGTEDKVQCVFCTGVLSHWEPDDNPDSEHKRHFGSCPFLKNPFSVGNVPVTEENATKETSEITLGGFTVKPVHQRYATNLERLSTYKDFPGNTSQTPKQFVDAGFFYSGIADNVKCFFCDGGLRNWDPEDVPWREHARWFPRCGYLQMVKGDQFIKEVQATYASASQQAVLPPPPAPRNTTKKYPVNSRKVQDYLGSSIACAVLQMGYEESLVKKVVTRRMEDLGNELFPNAESLLDAILEYEAEMNENEDKESSLAETNQLGQINDETNTENELSMPNGERKKKNKKKKTKKKKGGENDTVEQFPQSNNSPEIVVGNSEQQQHVNNEEAKKLSEDAQRLKEERICKICMDEEVNVVFLSCGHLVCCSTCAPLMRQCPICRDTIRGTVKVYLS